MKRELLSLAVLATLLLVPATGRAQSIKDLFNKDNISKVVNAVTGHTETVDMTGTWRYTGSDSTFVSTLGKRKLNGTYSYNPTTGMLQLKYMKLIPMNAKVNYTTQQMDLLFEADKLLKLITFLSSKSSSATLKAISSLADSYDGMMLGYELKR